MRLHELFPFKEERKDRKRIGRGAASGTGCTAGKGNKGQNSRSGGGTNPGFEGGQMPLRRRLPKRGFKNPFRVAYQTVNLGRIQEKFPEADSVSLEDLYQAGLCSGTSPVKILADGELSRAIKVEAHKFSGAAREKIQQAGGEAVALEG